jgi:hypothetical protein
MDARINELTGSFKIMTGLKDETSGLMTDLVKKITKLKEIYSEFVKNNKQSVFIFGLDSFHFQGKLIDIEYEDMNRLFLAITNRMYCEYFKLYRIIMEYISKTINDVKILDTLKINNNYPVYKDLEPFKVYPFEIINNIHDTIVTLLHSINACIINKEEELAGYKLKNNTGINIDNFVNTFNYNIIIMREKMVLFITYMEFFHKLHNKYLKRFTTKLHLMTNQINNDIKFDNIDQPKTNEVDTSAVKIDQVDDNVILNIDPLPNDNGLIMEEEIDVEEKEEEVVVEEKEEEELELEPVIDEKEEEFVVEEKEVELEEEQVIDEKEEELEVDHVVEEKEEELELEEEPVVGEKEEELEVEPAIDEKEEEMAPVKPIEASSKEEEKKENPSQIKEESPQTIKIKRAYKPRKQTKG